MAATATEARPLVLHVSPTLQKLSDEEFFEFCRMNPDWRIERTVAGDLVIMPPTGGRTGQRNFDLIGQFRAWVAATGGGVGFDSSTGFALPNGARRSPDLAWVTQARWDGLTETQRDEFPPLCPDFIVELRSRSDALESLQEKMAEYITAGARLGWLIDPVDRRVYVHRPSAAVVCLEAPAQLSGEPVLHGFILDLRGIWI